MAQLALARLTMYESVQFEIKKKAREKNYGNLALIALITRGDKLRSVFEHWTKGVNIGEQQWLAEKLTWEHLFPNEKSAFPGKRPKNPTAKAKYTGLEEDDKQRSQNECLTCYKAGEGPESEKCPYLMLRFCEKKGHGEYKFRLGTTEYREPRCTKCWRLRMEARSEGWEMI